MKECNTSWVEMTPTALDFFICPQGSGCKVNNEVLAVTLSPNPASNQFTLNNLPSTNVKVSIYDMSGRIIQNYNVDQNSIFDISGLSRGIYIVRANTIDDIIYTGKLFVVN